MQKAGITIYVAPYIIKPSSIALDFNKQVNPKIIQRKARHKKIETTLRYDHVSDEIDKFVSFVSDLDSIAAQIKEGKEAKKRKYYCYHEYFLCFLPFFLPKYNFKTNIPL